MPVFKRRRLIAHCHQRCGSVSTVAHCSQPSGGAAMYQSIPAARGPIASSSVIKEAPYPVPLQCGGILQQVDHALPLALRQFDEGSYACAPQAGTTGVARHFARHPPPVPRFSRFRSQVIFAIACRKTHPLEIFSCLANSLAICGFPVDSWIPRPLVEFLGPESKLVGPKTVTHGRPCSRSARKFWCCPRLRKCSRCCMQGWTTLGYRRTLGNCARKLCSEIQKTGSLS